LDPQMMAEGTVGAPTCFLLSAAPLHTSFFRDTLLYFRKI
jgi:hypothetical protein